MNLMLSRFFNILKYLLLVGAFVLTLLGLIYTYRRLEKSLIEAIPVFLPFILVFLLFIINLFVKKSTIKDNLLFNFTSCLVLIAIIIIGLRAKFDTNMLLFYKYKINYNPLYFSDNLSTIEMMLYCIAGASILFLIIDILNNKKVNKIVQMESSKEEINPSYEKKITESSEEVEQENIETKKDVTSSMESIITNPQVETNQKFLEIKQEVVEPPLIVAQQEKVSLEPIDQIPSEMNLKPVDDKVVDTQEKIQIKTLEEEKYRELLEKYNISEEINQKENMFQNLRK